MRLGGRAPGGGAKIATIASGLFGMVSGSAVANVATTGNFTIPLMKRLGYPPAMAGGTEAVASTGGQLAPPIMGAALIKVGIAPLVAHMFVFYYATLSVLTPPVCIAVFVAAGIAGARWGDTAKYALKLGAVTYVIPFLFIIYPGMLAQEGLPAFVHALFSGVVFVLAFANIFGGMKIFRHRFIDVTLWLLVAVLAVMPGMASTVSALIMTVGLYLAKKRFRPELLQPAKS